MTGSGFIDGVKKVADKTALLVINGIAGSAVANTGSVDGIDPNFPRASKGGKCPEHLLKRKPKKEVDDESVSTKEEMGGERQ